jgi:type IV secretory system conjugative DNA transfer VirD4/TraG family protein
MQDFSLDKVLVSFGNKGNWTSRNAVEGVQIFGGIGSGKTSGSGQMLALKFLEAGYGGLVLTVKPDEKEMWLNYCRQANRENDLLIVEPNGNNFFNFLDYESSTSGNSITENIVEVLKTVIRASAEKSSGRTDDDFWETALDMLIFNVIDLCKLAYGRITIKDMFDIVQTLPKSEDDESKITENENTPFERAYEKANDLVEKLTTEWDQKQSTDYLSKLLKENKYEDVVCSEVPEARTMKFLFEFFYDSLKNLNSRTRSIIDFSFAGFLFRLLREPVYSLFCSTPSTFTPEVSRQGKIILINLPVKVYHKMGRDCQIMFKYVWQRAMEKAIIKESDRPVFLWADEAQNFLHEHDSEYQATARSSKIATVYISQNLPNYYANMGGAKSEFRVKSFLGTLATKIFHANADIETNKYASDLIGDGAFIDKSKNVNFAQHMNFGEGKSLKFDKLVRPEAFARLKTGGPLNNNEVDAYLHFQGNTLADGTSHIKITFSQTFNLHHKIPYV